MIINGKTYKNKPITFNTVCKLEEMGVSITDMENHMMSAARGYAAICMHKPLTVAGSEIEEHVMNGGSLNDIIKAFGDEVEKSGFFQSLAQASQTETEPEADETVLEK